MGKRILSSFSASGQPFQSPLHLDHLQDAIKDNATAILKSIIGPTYDSSKVYILYGLVTSIGGGGSTNYSAGAVFTNGEVFLSPAQSLTSAVVPNVPVASVSTDYADGTGQTLFNDSSVHKICAYRNVTLSNAASGSGNLNGGASANNNFSAFLPIRANVTTKFTTGNSETLSFASRTIVYNTYTSSGNLTLNFVTANAIPGVRATVYYNTGYSNTIIVTAGSGQQVIKIGDPAFNGRGAAECEYVGNDGTNDIFCVRVTPTP